MITTQERLNIKEFSINDPEKIQFTPRFEPNQEFLPSHWNNLRVGIYYKFLSYTEAEVVRYKENSELSDLIAAFIAFPKMARESIEPATGEKEIAKNRILNNGLHPNDMIEAIYNWACAKVLFPDIYERISPELEENFKSIKQELFAYQNISPHQARPDYRGALGLVSTLYPEKQGQFVSSEFIKKDVGWFYEYQKFFEEIYNTYNNTGNGELNLLDAARNYLSVAKGMRLMSPEKYREILFDETTWGKMKKSVLKICGNGRYTNEFTDIVTSMAFVTADYVNITEADVLLVKGKHLVGLNNISTIPERRRF